jgi:tetratricopeptide (TPR) repeat protein
MLIIYNLIKYSFLVILILLSVISCTGNKQEKIPITTSSSEALQYYLQGRDLLERLRYQESTQYFEKALKLEPNFAIARLAYALVQPTIKKVLEELEKAVALADQVSEGERLMILGLQAGVSGLSLKQLAYYQRLIELYPNDERAHNLLGNYYFSQQDYNLAIKQYRRAIEIDPTFSQPYNQLGYSHRFLENYTEAEEAFKKYIELIPDDPNPYDSYAELLMKMSLFDESIKTYKKALKIDHYFAASHTGIATNLMFLEKHTEAREQLKTLFNIARNEGEQRIAKFATAITYIDEGKLDKAIEQLEWLYQLSQETDDFVNISQDLSLIGNILLEQNKINEAKEKYQKALQTIQKSNLSQEIKENSENFYFYNMARVSLINGIIPEAKVQAEEFSKRIEKLGNRNQLKFSHQLKGMIAFEEKKYNEALGEFGRSNLQNPYNLYRISLAYKMKGDITKAKEFCTKAANHNTKMSMDYAFIRKKAKQTLKEF